MTNPNSEGGDDPRLPTLTAWRQRLIDAGLVSKTTFKEAHLRMVLRSGRTAADQIRAMLPGSASQHADELAGILADLSAGGNRQDRTEPMASGGQHRMGDGGEGEVADGDRTAMISVGLPAATGPVPGPAARPMAFDVTARDFAPTRATAQRGREYAATVERTGGADRRISWPPLLPPPGPGETVVVYRLVSADDAAPYSPDRAHLIAATGGTAAIDPQATAAAVRHYQVWANIGPDLATALATQPVLHAAAVAVSPPTEVSVGDDNGHVIGRWTVAPSVAAVFVYRIPAEDAGRDGPQYRILADSDNRNGCVDATATRGSRYTYRLRAAANVDGVTRLSDPVDIDVAVSAVLSPVTDLTASVGLDGDSFDLAWTEPPGGHVIVFRTQNAPGDNAAHAELPEVALEQAGLGDEQRLRRPVSTTPGPNAAAARSVMTGVSWPAEWSRAYFTPVTVLAGRALLGKTVSVVRTGVIRDVELVEYCNKKVLTFDWPDGAAMVVVHIAPKGHDPRTGLTGKSFEISLEDYEKYGGMHLTDQLPATGCSLHLSPVAFTGGRRVTGAVRSIEYNGLLRLWYAVRVVTDEVGIPSHATIAVRSEWDLPNSPAFVLIHNPSRLPLSIQDGQPIDVAPVDSSGRISDHPAKELRWSALTTHGTGELWAANLRGMAGFVRLFVNSPSPARLRTIALLDPAVDTLRIPGPTA